MFFPDVFSGVSAEARGGSFFEEGVHLEYTEKINL